VIALIVFGPKRLPELGKSMGKGIREFKGSLSMDDKDEIPAERPTEPSEVAEGPAVIEPKA
jgi:sec-independent protein translocase protein TatA